MSRLGAGGYTPAITQQVYGEINARALAALKAGQSVIADAVFARPEDRIALAEVACAAGVPFVGLWIDAPAETLARRISTRTDDISDAAIGVLDDQLRAGVGSMGWHQLDGRADANGVIRQTQILV
jgi:hypothetical protein